MSVRHIHQRYREQIARDRKDNTVFTLAIAAVSFFCGMFAMMPLY